MDSRKAAPAAGVTPVRSRKARPDWLDGMMHGLLHVHRRIENYSHLRNMLTADEAISGLDKIIMHDFEAFAAEWAQAELAQRSAEPATASESVAAPGWPERARAALEPFGWIGSWLFARNLPDDTPMVTVKSLGRDIALTRGMFKAAHLAVHDFPALDDGSSAICAKRAPALLDEFEQAYRAFVEAFDTPVMRRQLGGEFAEDARRRLKEFAEHLKQISEE